MTRAAEEIKQDVASGPSLRGFCLELRIGELGQTEPGERRDDVPARRLATSLRAPRRLTPADGRAILRRRPGRFGMPPSNLRDAPQPRLSPTD
jgi:hypothetical protein